MNVQSTLGVRNFGAESLLVSSDGSVGNGNCDSKHPNHKEKSPCCFSHSRVPLSFSQRKLQSSAVSGQDYKSHLHAFVIFAADHRTDHDVFAWLLWCGNSEILRAGHERKIPIWNGFSGCHGRQESQSGVDWTAYFAAKEGN